jgi:hypothetical protein
VADRQSGAAASARGNRAALPTGAARTPGVALISYLHEARVLFVEFFLSTIEIVENGLSPFEDWVQILKGAMNDVSQQAVLRLDFGPVTPEEVAGLRSEKKLVTTDLTLEIRPRA